jgi:hypothetical protein
LENVRPISWNKVCNQEFSFAALKAAIYSASHDEAATILYFCAFHDTIPEPREKAYPPTLLCISRQFAQSESL